MLHLNELISIRVFTLFMLGSLISTPSWSARTKVAPAEIGSHAEGNGPVVPKRRTITQGAGPEEQPPAAMNDMQRRHKYFLQYSWCLECVMGMYKAQTSSDCEKMEAEINKQMRRLSGAKKISDLFDTHWKAFISDKKQLDSLQERLSVLRGEQTREKKIERKMRVYLDEALLKCCRESPIQEKGLEVPSSLHGLRSFQKLKQAYGKKYKGFLKELVADTLKRQFPSVRLKKVQIFCSTLDEETARGPQKDEFRHRLAPVTIAYDKLVEMHDMSQEYGEA